MPDVEVGEACAGTNAISRRRFTDADIDSLRNICRCGTYTRIREAIIEAADNM